MKDFDLPYQYDFTNMTFHYQKGAFGPEPELRHLDAIRPSLRDPQSKGPEVVYSIAMDVGFESDKEDLIQRNLLYGTVIYSSGALIGKDASEPIRSQGHIHAVSDSCGSSTAELYEIHSGVGIIYMQETAQSNPGRCYAVRSEVGELVLVPPGWAHMTISADPEQPLGFGAWCVRDYGFDYKDVRAHKGLAYFPLLNEKQEVFWQSNPNYCAPPLMEKSPRSYNDFGLQNTTSIYRQYRQQPNIFDFIPRPQLKSWQDFEP